MTVSELIAELQKHPGDRTVKVPASQGSAMEDVARVEEDPFDHADVWIED